MFKIVYKDKNIEIEPYNLKSEHYKYFKYDQLVLIARELFNLDNFMFCDFAGLNITDNENNIWYVNNIDGNYNLYIRLIGKEEETKKRKNTKNNKTKDK